MVKFNLVAFVAIFGLSLINQSIAKSLRGNRQHTSLTKRRALSPSAGIAESLRVRKLEDVSSESSEDGVESEDSVSSEDQPL